MIIMHGYLLYTFTTIVLELKVTINEYPETTLLDV